MVLWQNSYKHPSTVSVPSCVVVTLNWSNCNDCWTSSCLFSVVIRRRIGTLDFNASNINLLTYLLWTTTQVNNCFLFDKTTVKQTRLKVKPRSLRSHLEFLTDTGLLIRGRQWLQVSTRKCAVKPRIYGYAPPNTDGVYFRVVDSPICPASRDILTTM